MPGASPRSASRPGPRTAASRSPTVAWPRSSSTSRSSASSGSSPASTAWPVPSSTVRRRCPTSCSTASRPSRPPRSTSRLASRTRCTSTRPSRPRSTARSRHGVVANCADERKPGQTDQQFVYTTRKKAIGPFKRQLWDLDTKDEILAAQRRKISYLFTELRRQRLAADGRPLHPAGRDATGRSPTPLARLATAAELKRSLTARRRGAILPRRSGAGRRAHGADRPQRSPCVNSRGQLALRWVRWEEEISWRDQPITEDVAARDDAHLRSLGIKPELKRTLGFLSNFAVAFSYISVSTGTFTNQAVAFGVGGPRDLLGLAAGHPRPDLRRAQLRRAGEPLPGRRLDLPVVEAAVEPDARLVHRLDLLLGRRHHRDRGRGDRAARAVDDLSGRDQARRIRRRSPRLDMQSFIGLVDARHHDGHQRRRRPAAGDHQQHRRRGRDPRDGRLRADPAVLRQPPAAVGAVRHVVHGRPGRRQLLRRSSSSACSWPCSSSTASTPPGRSARRRVDASRQAPRGVLSAIWLSGHRRRDLPAGGDPVVQGHRGGHRRGPGVRVPDRRRRSRTT